jgi:thiol-disulfide isomerase/thioredoxin
MKKLLLVLIACTFGFMAQAQDYQRIMDKKTDRIMLKGLVTFQDIMKESAFSWFQEGCNYEYNQMVAENLERFYKPYHLVVFLGTWCGDTQDLLPKLYTVLRHTNFDFSAITLYAVDRNKEAINDEAKNFKVDRVPTIIVLHGDREVGRITESVSASIEHDLLAILEKDYLELERKRVEKWGE